VRVYHFLKSEHGLENIKLQRLKIARIDQLNDPFEWQAMTSSDPAKRDAISRLKAQQAKDTGILCFSRSWQNPVQWSHYADHHRGLCLGFDVADHLLGEVRYTNKRINIDWILAASSDEEGNDRMRQTLVTKFWHWRYEKEMRVFVRIVPTTEIEGRYFADFSNDLVLSEVIVGAHSDVSRFQLNEVLREKNANVSCRKARLSFKTFSIVEQRKRALWE
jgi:Protein of unknown function (DUF2971)